MLRDITIENYRCFKDFTITGLAPVNLIVGSNEIGKTSFMEAVYLLVNHRKPESLLSLLSNRGEILPATPTRYHVQHLFRGHQLNFFQKICLKSQQERPRQLEIKLSPLSPPNPEEKVEHDAPVFELIWFSEDAKFKFPGSPDGSIGGKFWRYGKTAPENIFTNHSNSSIFITTHSWDCICAFTEAVNELEDNSVGMLFRLSKKYGKLRPVEYTAEDLEIAVRQSIEVR